jgi:LmbE family N-acetylglucosaminyl deacetylase
MTNIAFRHVRRILCLGAHADDIEIGCGGTLLRLLDEFSVEVMWVVFSGEENRQREANVSAKKFLAKAAAGQVSLESFPDGFFPAHWADVKSRVAEISRQFAPDLVLTHRLEDRHQDHRTIAELTWNHFRSHTILEFEIPKFEGDLSTPNFYVGLSEQTCRQKIETICESFPSQRVKPWFNAETFWALLRLRGVESGVGTEYAEGFHARKLWV